MEAFCLEDYERNLANTIGEVKQELTTALDKMNFYTQRKDILERSIKALESAQQAFLDKLTKPSNKKPLADQLKVGDLYKLIQDSPIHSLTVKEMIMLLGYEGNKKVETRIRSMLYSYEKKHQLFRKMGRSSYGIIPKVGKI